jgi:hypothetical protein
VRWGSGIVRGASRECRQGCDADTGQDLTNREDENEPQHDRDREVDDNVPRYVDLH